MNTPSLTPVRDIYSVSRLNLEAQGLLESHFPLIWLEAEISNLSRPASGHLYFSLKDDRAQVTAAMFRGRNRLLRFAPAEGMQVLVRARVTLYQPKGGFQVIVEHMEQAGEGRLQQEFERLKEKLRQEGLFEPDRKKPLPAWPAQVGVITSSSGAALRDILHVLKRRCPGLAVVIYPAAVQGQDAPAQLRHALSLAIARNECDVLIMGRGGGSLEDLAAFNDEQLARDIAACPIPVVSAVGHEVDFALSDFVADLRAPTPSAAAEMVSPDTLSLYNQVQQKEKQLHRLITLKCQQLQQKLDHLSRQVAKPDYRLRQYAQQIDELDMALQKTIQRKISADTLRLTHLNTRLGLCNPEKQLAQKKEKFATNLIRLQQQMHALLERKQQALASLGKQLHLASPLATLERGYSITLREDQAVRSVSQVAPHDRLVTRVNDGDIISVVEKTTRHT